MLKAIIMAGGEGTRLRPLTCNIPKPMVKIMDKPVIEYIVELLKHNGIYDIGITLRYMPEAIEQYLGNGEKFGVNITYFVEDVPLGTAGSVKNAEGFLDDTFVVISGDALTDINITQAVEFHKNNRAEATLVLSEVDVPLEYGVVVTDDVKNIVRFVEKPDWSRVIGNTVNTGIYILEPSVLKLFGRGEMFDFGKDLFPMLLENKHKLMGFVSDRYWCDIGDTDTYIRCHYDILDKKITLPLSAPEVADGIWVANGVDVDVNAIKAPVYIGQNCTLGCVPGRYSVLESGVRCGKDAVIDRAILHSGVSADDNVCLHGCVIDNDTHIMKGAKVSDGAVVGRSCEVGSGCVIKNSIKVWPDKKILPDMTVGTNLLSGGNISKIQFEADVLNGEINIDITPETAAKIGATFGRSYPQGKIAVSRGDFASTAMLYNAIISGLQSSGCRVYDFGQQIPAITRNAVLMYGLDAGMHISTVKDEGIMKLSVDFMSETGANVSREKLKKLENVFAMEDFTRCTAVNIPAVIPMYDYKIQYIRDLASDIAGALNFNVLVSTPSYTCERLFKHLFGKTKTSVCVTEFSADVSNRVSVYNFCRRVATGDYDFGIITDEKCERILLADENGNLINADMYYALTAMILFEMNKDAVVYVPLTAPSVIEEIALRYGGRVFRTKTSTPDVMQKMLSGDSEPISNLQFMLLYNPLGAAVKIMEFMKTTEKSLGNIVSQIPTFHLRHKNVACPSDLKSRVITRLIQDNTSDDIDLREGIMISADNGWVHIEADNVRDIFKLTVQSVSEEYADELTDFYIDKINRIKD